MGAFGMESRAWSSWTRDVLCLLLGLFFLAAGTAANAVPPTKKEFPRLGGYQIGVMPYDGQWDSVQYQRDLAKLDLVILGGASPNSVASEIRRRNRDATVIKYTILMHASPNSQIPQRIAQRQKLDSEKGPNNTNAHDWWLRDSKGNRLEVWPNTYQANFLEYVRPDSRGERYPEFKARINDEYFFNGTEYNGMYDDSVFLSPRWHHFTSKPDFSGGQESKNGRIEAAYRRGHVAYWSATARFNPNIYRMVNGNWYLNADSDAWRPPDFDQQVHGGLMEKIMKESQLEDDGATPWKTVMTRYRRYIQYFLDPKLLMFVVQGDPDNYRFFRYTFATCLMNDGFYDYVPHGKYQYGTVEWFDEFDLAGTASTSWLGKALTSPPRSEWKKGVWRRDFEGGIALVNPLGNGTQTITVEKGFVRISGKQDQKVNNGRPVDTLTIPEGDGIILVRAGNSVQAINRPQSPQLVVQ